MAGGSRSNKKKSANGAGTSRSVEQQELNDGSQRRNWKVPETTEEWSQFGRTQADWPITDEEVEQWEYAWESYVDTHHFAEPPMWSPKCAWDDDFVRCKSCQEANADIDRVKEIWRKNREIQLEKEKLIAQRKRELKELEAQIAFLQQEISEEAITVREIKENYTGLEQMINEKSERIIRCQEIYPH